MSPDPADVTLETYEASAEEYLRRNLHARGGRPHPSVVGLLDAFARAVGRGEVLELGSGPGCEADYLESLGVRVTRSDATRAFVERLRERGQAARLIDVRTDELGGPWDGVLANAVLLHLSRPQLASALARVRAAVRPGGVLAVTLKEGDGEGWSTAKLERPRWFTYWREEPLRRLLARSGWTVRALDHVQGETEDWLHVTAV